MGRLLALILNGAIGIPLFRYKFSQGDRCLMGLHHWDLDHLCYKLLMVNVGQYLLDRDQYWRESGVFCESRNRHGSDVSGQWCLLANGDRFYLFQCLHLVSSSFDVYLQSIIKSLIAFLPKTLWLTFASLNFSTSSAEPKRAVASLLCHCPL